MAGTFPGLEVLGYFLSSRRDGGIHRRFADWLPTTHNPQPTTLRLPPRHRGPICLHPARDVQITPSPACLPPSAFRLPHGINDTIQAVIPAIYPLLKSRFALSFAQVGLITLAFQW